MRMEPPPPLRRLAAVLQAPVYLVGGAVRNALLGLPQSDLDAAGPLPPDAVEARCRAAGLSAGPVNHAGRALGTVGVRLDGETVEYTSFRAERYAPGGAHRPEAVRLGATLEEDAARRDFTINALYADCASGEVLDPLGGLGDLAAGVVRQAGPGTMRSDALRILRMVRIAGELGFSIEPGTFAAAQAHASGLADIAPQRRQAELVRILLCDARYSAALRDAAQAVPDALRRLTALGAWDFLLPEITDGREMAQRPDYHRYTVMEHLFQSCAAAPPAATLRLAALLHDVGKPACLRETGALLRHAAFGEAIVRQRLGALRFPHATVEAVALLVQRHMYDIQGTARERTLRKRFAAWGREATADLIALREADVRGSGRDTAYVCARWRALLQRMCEDGTPFSPDELAIGGEALMQALHLSPGPRVGQLKRDLYAHCVLRPWDNTPERLLSLARRMARR